MSILHSFNPLNLHRIETRGEYSIYLGGMNFHKMMTETHCRVSDRSHVPDVVYGNIAHYSELVPLDSFLSCGAY